MDTSGVMIAAEEGFASMFSVIIRGDGSTLFHDYYDGFSQNRFSNMENGEYGNDNIVDASVNNYGAEVEASVAGILWDIYDDNNDDYSTYNYFPQNAPFDSPDNIGDTLTDGIDNILSTLLDKNVNGHHPDNISEFWNAWFQSPSFDHIQAMKDIWYEHGILNGCCIGIRGNINGDQQDIIDISDLLYLVDFMFDIPSGPAPVCFEEADLNGSGGIDIADLVYRERVSNFV